MQLLALAELEGARRVELRRVDLAGDRHVELRRVNLARRLSRRARRHCRFNFKHSRNFLVSIPIRNQNKTDLRKKEVIIDERSSLNSVSATVAVDSVTLGQENSSVHR